MAITACSSSNHSSTLPAVSLYYHPTKSCLKAFNTHPPAWFSPSKNAKKLAPEVAFKTAAITEAVALTNAGVEEAARVSVVSHWEIENLWALRESVIEGEKDQRNGALLRRKKRRKRRKASENFENERAIKNVSAKPGKSGQYLTRKAESEYSFCLKEEAKVEALRKKVEDTSGHRLTLTEWAKAARMSRVNLDKILYNGREAQDRIISCYRRLVISVASSYQGKGLSLQDLIQEGNLGLLHGARKFNPEKGYKLSTYVYWWIRQAIGRAIAKKSRITRLPGSISELVPRICETNAMFSRRLHRLPTCDEVAEAINKDALTVGLALERNRQPISLDQPITDGNQMSLQAIIPGPDETTPEAMVKKQFMKKDIENLLNGLCDREVNVLKLHYGLNGDTPQSFEDIGRHFKLSRERARQINCTALSKLRQTSTVNDLKVYIA